MHRRSLILMFAFWACSAGADGAARTYPDRPIFAGVLEDVHPGNLSPGMSTPHVRLLFSYDHRTWRAASDIYPVRRHWVVVFDGRRVGEIESRVDARPPSYGDVGIEAITTRADRIPRIGTGASNFDYAGNQARSRPLLVVSVQNFQDPDRWKPTVLTSAEMRMAITAFRRKVPSMELCDHPEEKPIHMVPCADAEIQLINAYRSRAGEVMVGQRLSQRRSNCGFFDDPVFFDYWFALQGPVTRFLGTQLTPLDAADLAGTGSSVWVFHTARGEDEEGYELFYDDFSRKASIDWTYH